MMRMPAGQHCEHGRKGAGQGCQPIGKVRSGLHERFRVRGDVWRERVVDEIGAQRVQPDQDHVGTIRVERRGSLESRKGREPYPGGTGQGQNCSPSARQSAARIPPAQRRDEHSGPRERQCAKPEPLTQPHTQESGRHDLGIRFAERTRRVDSGVMRQQADRDDYEPQQQVLVWRRSQRRPCAHRQPGKTPACRSVQGMRAHHGEGEEHQVVTEGGTPDRTGKYRVQHVILEDEGLGVAERPQMRQQQQQKGQALREQQPVVPTSSGRLHPCDLYHRSGVRSVHGAQKRRGRKCRFVARCAGIISRRVTILARGLLE